MRAQTFADGIPPDVAGDVFDGIGRAKNVVVVAHFPKTPAMRFPKFEGGPLFEEADEFRQVAAGVGARRKDMKMVRHEAKGVQAEGMAGRAFEQKVEDALGGSFCEEMGHAVVATDSDEIRLATEVVSRSETGDPAVGRHTGREYTARNKKEKAPGWVRRETEGKRRAGETKGKTDEGSRRRKPKRKARV
jgi:hypothetical protein